MDNAGQQLSRYAVSFQAYTLGLLSLLADYIPL